MNVTISDRQIKIGMLMVFILVVLIFIIICFRSRSKFEYPAPVATADTSDTTYNSALNTCQDTYNQALIAARSDVLLIFNAEKTRSTCITTASQAFVKSKCTFTDGTIPTTDPNKAYYDTFTSDTNLIQQGYIPAQRQIATADVPFLNAARKADISGATRKYMSSVCPAFYKTSDGDLTSTYSAWNVGPSVNNGFVPLNVTTANIGTWADYAATTFSVNDYYKSSTPASGDIGPITLTSVTNLAVGDKVQFIYQTPLTASGGTASGTPVVNGLASGTIKTITGLGIIITLDAAISTGLVLSQNSLIAKPLKSSSTKWKMAGATTTPNWKLARDAGPGTVPGPQWATV